MDQPLFGIRNLLNGLDGVVERIAEDRREVDHVHKVERSAVRNNGQRNPMFLAIQAFSGKDGIQHIIAGLVLRFIGAKFGFHAVDCLELIRSVNLGTQNGKLVLEIMVFLVDEIHGFLSNAVVFILLIENALQRVALSAGERIA